MRTSLFHFLPRAPLLVHHDRAVLGKTVHCSKGKRGATAYSQHIIGGAEEGTTFLLKGRSGAGFSYTIFISEPMLLASQFGIEGNTQVWDLITCR